jgi:hypothetical protein
MHDDLIEVVVVGEDLFGIKAKAVPLRATEALGWRGGI